MKHHMSVSIEGLLRNFARKKITFMQDDNGRRMSDSEARTELKRLQSLGHKYLPTSPNCVGFDPFENGCPGHESEQKQEETK